MPAEILSLDMDWFNVFEYEDLRLGVEDFFAGLKKHCKIPKAIDLVPQHQYLYPWAVKLMDGLTYRKMNIVNVDEHHDFYNLSSLDLNDAEAEVGCWNFFAFMAHQKMISKYCWVTNRVTVAEAKGNRSDLLTELRGSSSKTVRDFKKRVQVVHTKYLTDVVKGRKFDGFILVRSSEYTVCTRSVYHAVDRALEKVFPRVKVRRYKCRLTFQNQRMRRRANSLFWGL